MTEIDGHFYMTYTAYGYEGNRQNNLDWQYYHGGGTLPTIAHSENLNIWEQLGDVKLGEDNKDHVLFPKRIKNRYAMLHRRRPDVWIAYSDDLITLPEKDMKKIYEPRSGSYWDNTCVGSNGVPIETSHGWILINHGYAENRNYHFGVILFDIEDPTQVINRPA